MAGARSRNYTGWPLFANSFRPFFLFAAIQAGLSILVWLPLFHGELSVSSAFAPRDWHVHEMLYGFLPAVITGFLFTAIPNWTGRLPIQGISLGGLLVVWLAGRAAVTLSADIGWAFALAVDAAFLALVVINLVNGFQALGTLLAVGLMILPAGIARFWSRDLTAMICIAVVAAAVSGYAGLVLSFQTRVPSGPAIILVATVLYIVSVLFGRVGGIVRQLFPGRHLEA